jgi:tRNA pseudouridine55 synthase
MARRRRQHGRPVDGILLLDKPIGLTSNAALQQVKRLFGARKAGHTGSLDPLATGMLPICFGEATKLSGFLLDSDKSYQAVIQLGVRTRTGDAEGDVLERRDASGVTRAMIDEVLLEFNGDIKQIPPMYSALKQNGQPLYKLAHQGIVVERQARKVTIHDLQVTGFASDRLSISVRCSKGTYIRTLAEDIGDQLGCGAHIAELRRDGVGTFAGEHIVTMDSLERLDGDTEQLDRLLLGPDQALLDWPEISLGDDVAYFLKRGQPVLVPKSPGQGYVRVYNRSQNFLGVGHILDDGRLAPKRLLSL